MTGIGSLELLIVGALGVPMMFMAAIALWMLARMVNNQDRYDPRTVESMTEMSEGLKKLETRLGALEEVMLHPDTATVRRHN